ncbi:peptidoglycan-binding protein [Kitasatospora sp. DSM 101779]|uniref:peptidoglycan-binding protein n=1 Tax=Kitasatospora sp. DSM 101779 TaxID=2853165 RepID=UPI0021D90E2F|nr:peptidoglycan-binding protein [Kitasatospora sp. DSM 101779]MCU7823721.1 peptidoglycan-binding protein [Kitasatospora sp. DSM 101779]
MGDLIREPEREFDGEETAAETVGSGRSRLVRRRRALLAVAASAALVACGGLGAAGLVKSPAERAADTAPPPGSVLTAEAAMKVLTRSTVTRGQVYPPTRYDVTPAPSSPEITQLYVSALSVKAGDAVANGQLLAEVSGRPLFVLKGAVPAYRDLKPGASGSDVAQLQAALAELGHLRGGDAEGEYGPGTARAVTDFYRQIGHPAPTAGAAAAQAVDAAKRAVDADQRTVDELKSRQSAPAAPPSDGASAAPSDQAGQSVLPDLAAQLDEAERKLSDDRAALARAEEADGPVVPAGEAVFLPVLPAAVTAVNAAVGGPVAGPLLSLTSGDLVVTGQLTPGQAPGIAPGMAVEILAENTGTVVRGKVAELGPRTTAAPAGRVIAIGGAAAASGSGSATGSASGGAAAAPAAPAAPPAAAYVPLRITPDEPLPAALSGQNVRITVQRSATAQPVLCVPVAAVYTDATGRTAVTRIGSTGRKVTVPVTTGVNADGYVSVIPVQAAQLQPGDQVVVGR